MIKRKNHLLVTISLAIIAATLVAFSQSSHDDLGGTTAPQLEASWRVIVTPIDESQKFGKPGGALKALRRDDFTDLIPHSAW